MRILNEKVINSRRNRIYSLKVFHFLLYRQLSILQVFTFYIVFNDLFLNWFSTCVCDNRRYVCDCRLYACRYVSSSGMYVFTWYACIITQKFKGLDSRQITSLPEIKNMMRTQHVILIITKNKLHVDHKTHLHTIKVYNSQPVSLC